MNKKIQVLQTYSKCSSEPEIIDQQNDVNYGIQNYDDDGMYETQYIGEQKNDEPVQYQQKKEKVEVQGLNFEKQSNPQCSEHLINNMIYDLDKSNIPKLDDLSRLKKMINDYEQIDSKIIDQLFDSMKTGLKNNDTTKLISDLKELLIQTRPLNIEGTNQLINRAEEAAYKVKDQEVILLMGQTGAGKSTTVYFLAGQKLKLDKIDIGKKQFVYNFTPDGQIINQDLQQINISYKGESETRYITPVKIEFDEDGFERTAIICDSPGFGDSAGAEVDIANGIGIIEAIKLCLSVRPVILVSQMMVGDRGDGLKKLTHLIVSMFKGNIQDYLPSFTYLYSKFPQETDINSFLQNIYNSIKNEEDDSSFQAIFKDMLKKSKKKQNSVIFDKINPLKEQDRNSILENILDKKPIKNPDDVFQYIITENSRSKLFEQTNLHEKCIQNALQNYHFDLVNHKMNQLKLIKDKLKLGQLETVYNQQVESIKKFISQQYNIKINEFNKILENQNDVQQNDIIKYQNFTKKIRSAEILKHNHISDLPCTSELYQNIILQGNQLLKRLETIDVYDSKFITDFNNLYFLNQDFSDLKNIFKNALEQFDSYFESLHSQSIINFAQKKYLEVAESLNCIQQFIKIFDKKIDTSMKKQVYPKIIKQINDQISSINDQCALIIQKEKFEENELNKLIEYQQIYQNLSETHQIYDHIPKELIQEASDKFYNHFLNYFEGILNQIKEIFQMDRDNNSINQDLFKTIKSQLQKMETLRNQIKNLDHKSYKIYHYCLQITSSYVIEVRTKSIQLIDQLKKDPQNFDCQQLENILIKLKNSEWIDNHQDGLYSETIKQLDYQIKKQLQSWKDQLDELPLDLKNSQNIQQGYKIKQYSEKMKIFQVQFPAIEKIIQNISDRFNQAFQSNIDFIKNQFKPINQEELKNHLDIQTAELALIFLNNCKKQVSLRLNIQEAENIFHEFLKNYKNESQNQMEIYLDYILNAEDDEKMINISDYSMRVYHRINNIQAMDGFKNLCEVIDTKDIIKKIINKLKHIFEDLMGKLQGTDVRDMQNYLTKTRTLSQFDEFIQNKTENFFSLYQEFQNKNSQELKDDQKKLIEMIDKKQYEQFSYGVNDIGNLNNKFKNQIKNNLQHSINEQSQYLNIKILMMNKDLNQKEINDIIQMLQYLKKAKQYIPTEYMDPQTSSDLDKNLTKFQDQITQKINDRIKQIENYLYYNGFLEAVELKEQFNDSVKLLVDCIQALDIQNQIQELDKKIDNMIVNQCKNQGNIKIEDYCNNPPKQLLEKLIEVIQKKSLYAQEYKKLEAKITNDIQKEINSIKQCNYEQKIIKIRDLEQAITYLPNILMEQLNKKIIEEKTKIEEDNKHLSKELEDLKDSDDFKKQFQFINRCKKEKNDELLIKMENYIDMKIDVIQNQILSFLHDKEYENALKQYVMILKYYTTFEEQKFIEIVNTSKENLQQKFENSISQIQLIKQKSSQQHIIEKSYEYYQQFIKFNNNIKRIVSNINLTFYSKNEDKLEDELISYFQNLYHSYEDSLKNFEIKKLEESLQEMKKWQILMKNIITSQNMSKLIKTLNGFQKDYSDMQKEVSLLLQENSSEINKENFNIDQQEKELEGHYQKLQSKIVFNGQASRIKEFILSDYFTQSFEQDIQPKLLSKIKDQTKSTIDIIEQKDKQIDDRDFRKIRINLKNVITYQKFSNEQEIRSGIEQIKDAIILKINKYMQQCDKKDINIAVQNLINIQTFIDEIPQVSKDIRIYMQQVLKRLKKECNPKEFSQIYILLEQDNGHGKSILQEHESLFKGYQIQLFKSNTAKHNIDYIMKYIEGDQIDSSNFMKKFGKDPIDKGKLEKFYKKYEEKYQELIQKYITKQKNKADKQDDLIIKELANKVKSIPSKKFNQEDIQWNVQDEIIEIMAYIFTIWTFSDVQYYNEMEGVDQKQREDYLLQPHAGQIIAIFRILGIGYADGYFKTLIGLNESRLVNNLIQIGTGEGKSVTLAVTSCILALYDIDVYCACYSEYLSKRDYDSFSNLFEKLGLVERIHYGTFNKLCESVINDQFNIRQKVIDIIQQSGASDEQIKIQNRRKILLIDEVDVFFSEDFYGNIYAPLAKIKNPKIKKLTDFLWQNREGDLKMKLIENTLEFKELCQQFKGWENLIKEIVKSMKQDLQCFKHDYVVQNQKIGYKEQDQIVFNIVYGYKTMWAYYDEFKKNNVTQSVLEDNISIQIKCGAFSFAEIPKIFMNIMGVSGTLKTMSEAEKKIISDDYKIKIFTYMPSIFGQNQCEFNEKAGVKFWNKDDYFKEIKVEIKNNIGAKPNQRACLVFFETREKLMKFYEHYQLDEQNIQYLTEESNSEEQSFIIKKSTNAGSVTLSTKLFGRGIDFIVRDQNINSNRGMHVLQTFLSEEVSEETQIKGRTARQGQKGTYSMVLLNEDLEKYIGSNYLEELKEMQHNNNLYAKLNDKRNEYIHNKQKSINEMIQKIKKEHDDAISFKQNLLKKHIGNIQSFLLNQNRGEPEQIQSRTICLMDATGSMSSLLQKTKNTVGQMFQRASDILKEHKIPEDCFQLQFVVFRDYDCMEGILQYSTWESKPDQLRSFMDKISAKGGGGNYAEAIEIGLLHCNRENQNNSIDQIILIGDEPAKEQLAIDRDRKYYGGEDYWIKNGFPNTHYLKELEKLKQENIPVHSFYLEEEAKSNFEQISKLTNGKSGQLKINKESGSEQLTALVTEFILQSFPKAQELVESYRKKFGKAFA